jgi:hypothetical protein
VPAVTACQGRDATIEKGGEEGRSRRAFEDHSEEERRVILCSPAYFFSPSLSLDGTRDLVVHAVVVLQVQLKTDDPVFD